MVSVSAVELAKLLDAIIDRAPRLRTIGVLSLAIGDVAITLAAAEQRADPAPATPAGPVADDADDPGLGPRKLKLRERPL
jgi:hypothetical protein